MSAVDRVVEAVAAYVRGWWLVALIGKRPVAEGWSTAPRATREQVESWAAHDNVGVRCGESGLAVIDDDTADHSAATTLGLPRTWTVITGSGGRHYYFDASPYEIRNSASKLAEKVDVRAQGGQCVLPGGIHPETGESYRWAPGFSPDDLPLARLPADIAARLTKPTSRRGRTGSNSIPDAARARRYAEAALKAECDHVAATGEGARNDQLVRSAFSLGQLVGAGTLAHAEVVAGLEGAAHRCGLPEDEASRTIASGLKAGEAEPRDLSDFVSNGKPHPTVPAQPRRRIIVPTVAPFVPFPVDALPSSVASIIRAHAGAIGCDLSMVALPLIAGLAASIGNSRRIRLKSTWSEPSILWLVLVADSGMAKSPALDAGLAPLRKIQSDALRDYTAATVAHRAQMQCYAAALADWKKKRGRGPDPPTPPVEAKAWRILVSDTTVEAIAPILRDNARGLLLARDELSGFFQSFDAYRKGRGGDAARWLEMHRAGPLTVDRKTGDERIIHVPRASLSIAGTIQPAILRSALGHEHFQDGMAARLLLAMPPRMPRVWTDATVSPEIEAAHEKIVARLLALGMKDEQPVEVDLSSEGRAAFVEFFNQHGREQLGMSGDLLAAWSKLEGYAARLALVVHLARAAAGETEQGEGGEVAEQDVAAAVRLTHWFCGEATRVYEVLAQTPEQVEARGLIELMHRRGGSITARDLRRANRRYTTPEAAAAALAQLVEDGIADWVDITPGDQGGRPTRTCRLREHVDAANVDESPEFRQREQDGGSP